MIRPIVKDTEFLSKPAEKATNKDRQIITDLKDTLRVHCEHCAGMAANMIGENKSIIIISDGKTDLVMVNPRIIAKHQPYEAEEGCLSLEGMRTVTRYEKITVEYLGEDFKKHIGKYDSFTAEVIQHECDHLAGIII